MNMQQTSNIILERGENLPNLRETILQGKQGEEEGMGTVEEKEMEVHSFQLPDCGSNSHFSQIYPQIVCYSLHFWS